MIAADLQNPHQPLTAPYYYCRSVSASCRRLTGIYQDVLRQHAGKWAVTRQGCDGFTPGRRGCGTGDMDRVKRDISVNHG